MERQRMCSRDRALDYQAYSSRTKAASLLGMAIRRTSAVVFAALFITSAVPAQTNRPANERFTAFAVDLGGMSTRPATTAHVEITLDHWSSKAEQERLTAAMRSKRAGKTLDVLRNLKPVGRIQFDNNLGYDLRLATQESTGDGRKVTLVTDRPMTFWEAWNQPRSAEYPFTFVELNLDASGHGSGRMMPAVRISVSDNGNYVFLENYDIQSVRLNDVEAEKRSERRAE
jgi:hypothetical protein